MADWTAVKAWMGRELLADAAAYADSANVLQATQLAEAAAGAFDLHDELDDEASQLWDLAADAVEAATRRGGQWNR